MDRVFAKVDKQGRIVLPAKYRNELDINVGDNVMVTIKDKEIRVKSRIQALKEAQELFQKNNKIKGSVVDEFIKWKRNEARSE